MDKVDTVEASNVDVSQIEDPTLREIFSGLNDFASMMMRPDASVIPNKESMGLLKKIGDAYLEKQRQNYVVPLKVKYLPNYNLQEWGPLKQARQFDAGFDLRAAIPTTIRLNPSMVTEIPTGIAVEIPEGYELQIRPRGSASRDGLIIVNSPGTVDAGYRGEIIILVVGRDFVKINPGERIAQAVVGVVPRVKIIQVRELSPSERGDGKLGSTGRI